MSLEGDAQLVRRVMAGDRESYAYLVERYQRLARATATHLVRDPHLADDVVQETFLAAYRSLGALRRPERFAAWLLGIARRQAAKTVRQRMRAAALSVEAAGQVPSHAEGQVSAGSYELLELIERLPLQEQVVIGLRHFEGHSVHDVALITERPVGTVTKQLSRAHQRLRAWLEEEVCR